MDWIGWGMGSGWDEWERLGESRLGRVNRVVR